RRPHEHGDRGRQGSDPDGGGDAPGGRGRAEGVPRGPDSGEALRDGVVTARRSDSLAKSTRRGHNARRRASAAASGTAGPGGTSTSPVISRAPRWEVRDVHAQEDMTATGLRKAINREMWTKSHTTPPREPPGFHGPKDRTATSRRT